jgi:hypothetical protein
LCNASTLRVSNRSTHFIDWSAAAPNPETLTLEHLPAILASGTHFARKFDPDRSAALLDALDARLDAAAIDRAGPEDERRTRGSA